MSLPTRHLALAVSTALALAACGGAGGQQASGGPPPPPPTVTKPSGIALPSEISALPAKGLGGAALVASDLPADSDYANTPTVKWVNEPALSQFDILNTIFAAVGQTHYADPDNVNAGPYGAIVSWTENNGDREQRVMKRWVVDSQVASPNGTPVNTVLIWMLEPKPDGVQLIRARLEIEAPPVRNADGSYSDYGVWTLHAAFGQGAEYFAASASRESGRSKVMVHEVNTNGQSKGVLFRGAGSGHGKVEYPDWSQCNSQDCAPPAVTVAYVYDADAVALSSAAGVDFKSRTSYVDLVNRYGLFDATGADVTRTHHFGFPVRWTASGVERYAYYGAWQGRHQLWANNETLPAGLAVSRADRGPNDPPANYVTSAAFTGTLVKRFYVPAALSDLAGLVLDTRVQDSGELTYDGTGWSLCRNPAWTGGMTPTCDAGSGPIADLSFLAGSPMRQVWLGRWDQATNTPMALVYQGNQFFVAAQSPSGGPPVATGQAWTPQAGDRVNVNASGEVWVLYDGQDWWEKQVVSVDPFNHTPTFGAPGTDTPFTFTGSQDHFLNANGVTWVLAPDGLGVKVEQQEVANPLTAATLAPAGTTFRRAWNGDTASTFVFDLDAASPTWLKLVYGTPGPSDAAAGRAAGDPLDEPAWTLNATAADGSPVPEAFTWEYPQGGQGWGAQQYLVQDGTFVLLDDPIRLQPIALRSHGGALRTYALTFDGSWVNGLPDTLDQLRKNGYRLTPALADQVVVIPSGAVVADAADPQAQYVFKPLQVSQLLTTIANPGNLDVVAAEGLTFDGLPGALDTGMSATVPVVALRYSEGAPVP